MTNKNMDKEIKQWVQSVERDIPLELEDSIMKELGQIASTPASLPDHIHHIPLKNKRPLLLVGTLAAAASLLLAVILLVTAFPSLFHRERAAASGNVAADGVFVDSAQVEGVSADTFIIDQKDPDMTIVWLEKAPIIAKNN
jgi:negative regulator of sigma E activity